MSDSSIVFLIIVAFIGIIFAVPAPEPKKASEPPPGPKPIVVNVYRTSHVHKHVVVKVQMLVVAPEPLAATRPLERYKAPSELPAPRVKIEA